MSEETLPPRRRFRPRLSIRAALFLMTIVALAISVILLWREVGPLREQVRRLRVETGQLTVADSRKVYGISIPTIESDTWRWRIYLPPGTVYNAYAYSGNLLSARSDDKWLDAVRAAGKGKSFTCGTLDGEVTIDCRIEKVKGAWSLKTMIDKYARGVTENSVNVIPKALGDSLSKSGTFSFGAVARRQQFEYRPDEPILLLFRTRRGTSTGGTAASPPTGTDGIALWIEPTPQPPQHKK